MLRGDFGWSFQWGKPVGEVIAERLPITLTISLLCARLLVVGRHPIGIYSATHQYSLSTIWRLLSVLSAWRPRFLLAMILAWAANQYFGFSALGLYSTEFLDKPWSMAKQLTC